MSEKTLKEMADTIAAQDGRDPAVVLNSLRNPNIKRLLNPIEGEVGRTSAGKYDIREFCRARMLMAIVRSGLDAREVEQANRVFSRPIVGDMKTFPASMTDNQNRDPITSLMRGVRNKEPWKIEIEIFETGTGSREINTFISWPGYVRSNRARKSVSMLRQRTHLVTVIVHCDTLLFPFVEHAEF